MFRRPNAEYESTEGFLGAGAPRNDSIRRNAERALQTANERFFTTPARATAARPGGLVSTARRAEVAQRDFRGMGVDASLRMTAGVQ